MSATDCCSAVRMSLNCVLVSSVGASIISTSTMSVVEGILGLGVLGTRSKEGKVVCRGVSTPNCLPQRHSEG